MEKQKNELPTDKRKKCPRDESNENIQIRDMKLRLNAETVIFPHKIFMKEQDQQNQGLDADN